jgi:hypothetical protein
MRGKKLFVGKFSHCVAADEEVEQLRELLALHGEVHGINLGKGKRYGFVEMFCRFEAEKGKNELHDRHFNGCNLAVNEVIPTRRRQRHGRRR